MLVYNIWKCIQIAVKPLADIVFAQYSLKLNTLKEIWDLFLV